MLRLNHSLQYRIYAELIPSFHYIKNIAEIQQRKEIEKAELTITKRNLQFQNET